MPRFKVTLQRPRPKYKNPFHAGLINQTQDIECRSWEIEAADEKEIHDFLDDARANDLPNVRGFELRSIKALG